MPPKRRPPAQTGGQEKKARQSKIAKENNISADEEGEIKEAYHLFSIPHQDFEDEKEGVISIADVRRALIALGLPPNDQDELNEIIDTVDPTSTGFATYPSFVTVCALKLHSRSEESISHEVEAAYRLFTGGGDGPITMAHLRRIAALLKEDVSEDVMKDMMLEAKGGGGVSRGVGLQDFEGVMRRAGVFK